VAAVETRTGWNADEAVTRLFAAHHLPLTRLATLLTSESGLAEEIVADAYVQLHARWRLLDDQDKALAYLRAIVVNRSRSALRHRRVVDRHVASTSASLPDAPSAESAALDRITSASILAALAALPARQREALVLRYYGDLSESEIADTMGCSRGAVKSHLSRGMAALRRGAGQWS
jgi:RNA polymerase sigma-70 factor (sigma-E family)